MDGPHPASPHQRADPASPDPAGPDPARAEIVVDLDAIRHNVRLLADLVAPARLMVVVKADGYGHGMVPVARAAREAGATWLGAATLDEVMTLRTAGDTGRLLTWLTVPGEDYRPAIEADVDLTAYTTAALDEITAAAGGGGQARRVRVQLKIDTGLSRGGATAADWPGLVAHAAALERQGLLTITGIWSHLACADDPEDPANDRQERAFRSALKVAEEAGLRPEVRHLANSAAAVLRPSARFDLVRCGIASYGLHPAPGRQHAPGGPDDLGLRPAMTARAGLAMSKTIPAGAGVSYGHAWVAKQETTVGLVPLGYAEGVPRHASNRAEVWMDGRRRPIRGRVCMDQFVVDLDGDLPAPGTEVVLFGPGDDGEPTAQDWAEAAGTIHYEIVTRIGGRATRRYEHEHEHQHHVETREQGENR